MYMSHIFEISNINQMNKLINTNKKIIIIITNNTIPKSTNNFFKKFLLRQTNTNLTYLYFLSTDNTPKILCYYKSITEPIMYADNIDKITHLLDDFINTAVNEINKIDMYQIETQKNIDNKLKIEKIQLLKSHIEKFNNEFTFDIENMDN